MRMCILFSVMRKSIIQPVYIRIRNSVDRIRKSRIIKKEANPPSIAQIQRIRSRADIAGITQCICILEHI